jgi:aminopeptidase-like protein
MSPDVKSFLGNVFDKLYLINRTICGDGYDKSPNILKKFIKYRKIIKINLKSIEKND